MAYTLNGKNITSYGLYPSRGVNSNLAISGCWDFPERINTAFYDWGDANGIEPYLEPGQIFFGGRTITLTVALLASSRNDAVARITNMYRDIDAFTGLVQLACSFGTFNVYVNDAIAVNYVRNGKALAKLSFREPVPDLSGTSDFVTTESGGEFITEDGGIIMTENSTGFVSTGSLTGIDGISFPALGIAPLSFANVLSRPAPKPMSYKSYETEGYEITKRKERTSVLKGLIVKSSYTNFINTIKGLYGLFSQANEHMLSYPNDSKRTFFVKDGFSITDVNIIGNTVTALINISITETGRLQALKLLTDNGLTIETDSSLDFAIGDETYETEF